MRAGFDPALLRLAAALLPLLLTACWMGKQFYAADELVAPIPPGFYVFGSDSSSDPGRYHVSVRQDRHTAFEEPDGDTSIAGFAPLPGNEGKFVAWFRDAKGEDDRTLWYGLLEKRGSEFFLALPDCGETRSIAESVGAEFSDDPKTPVCGFHDRASLETALKRVAVEGPIEWTKLVPGGKEGKNE